MDHYAFRNLQLYCTGWNYRNLDVDTKYYAAAHQNNSKIALYIIECSIYTEAGKLKNSTSFMIAWDKE